jgi:hypothetical protein
MKVYGLNGACSTMDDIGNVYEVLVAEYKIARL